MKESNITECGQPLHENVLRNGVTWTDGCDFDVMVSDKFDKGSLIRQSAIN